MNVAYNAKGNISLQHALPVFSLLFLWVSFNDANCVLAANMIFYIWEQVLVTNTTLLSIILVITPAVFVV